jgi:hypothetical protein
MHKLLFATLLAPLLTAAAAQAANPIQTRTVVVRVTDTPTFLPTTSQCPAARFEIKLRSAAGEVIGATEACFRSDELSGHTETVDLVETFSVPGGPIETHQTLVAVFNADFSSEVFTASWTVTRAQGVYLGKTGTVAGSGTIAFDANGTPHPDGTFTITLA